jgi:hypothetical protein
MWPTETRSAAELPPKDLDELLDSLPRLTCLILQLMLNLRHLRPHRALDLTPLLAKSVLGTALVLPDRALGLAALTADEPHDEAPPLAQLPRDAVPALAEYADDPVTGDRAASLESAHVATDASELAFGGVAAGPRLDRSGDPVADLEGRPNRYEKRRLGDTDYLCRNALCLLALGLQTGRCGAACTTSRCGSRTPCSSRLPPGGGGLPAGGGGLPAGGCPTPRRGAALARRAAAGSGGRCLGSGSHCFDRPPKMLSRRLP